MPCHVRVRVSVVFRLESLEADWIIPIHKVYEDIREVMNTWIWEVMLQLKSLVPLAEAAAVDTRSVSFQLKLSDLHFNLILGIRGECHTLVYLALNCECLLRVAWFLLLHILLLETHFLSHVAIVLNKHTSFPLGSISRVSVHASTVLSRLSDHCAVYIFPHLLALEVSCDFAEVREDSPDNGVILRSVIIVKLDWDFLQNGWHGHGNPQFLVPLD